MCRHVWVLDELVYTALQSFVKAMNPDINKHPELAGQPCKALPVLSQFACFSKEAYDEGTPFSTAVFSLSCLHGYKDKITWHSNLFTPLWCPEKTGDNLTIFTYGATSNSTGIPTHKFDAWAPVHFRKLVHKDIRPNEDPLALILFCLKKLGLLSDHWYASNEPSLFFLSHISPRYVMY